MSNAASGALEDISMLRVTALLGGLGSKMNAFVSSSIVLVEKHGYRLSLAPVGGRPFSSRSDLLVFTGRKSDQTLRQTGCLSWA